MAQDIRKALDDKTRKLSQGRIEDGKEHAAYQETQQQLLAIQAEQQQNLAVARAESKASFENNQTLAQAAELGAISAAEAEQAATMGAQAGVQLNPATQQILSKYGAGQPRFQRTSSHSQQVTKQNITINNNITSNTTNDVNVPANTGGPIQGRPLQFKNPSSGDGSVGKFKTWISAAFARQNEEGARRDREYRNRESSLTKSANKMMRKLEDIGKTIGSRMDPRKIGSTWQSQLKTLLLLFGFGYLASNWTKILDQVSKIENWVKDTKDYFTGGGLSNSIASLFGGKPGQPILDSLKSLLIGNEEEKGLFGHLKQFFNDMWEERAEAVKMVKTPEITNALNDPMTAIKSLFEYLSNILTAAFSGAEGIKKIRLEEAGEKVTKKADENRLKNSTTDLTVKRKINGENVDVELGTSAYKSTKYKGISHHMLEGNELTSKFGAESSVAQMSELGRLIDTSKKTGVYHADDIAVDLGRLSRYAGKQGMIPVNKRDLLSILSSSEYEKLVASGDIKKNVKYREVYRPKKDEDYYRNFFGNDYLDPRLHVGTSAALNTFGADAYGGIGHFRSKGTILKDMGKRRFDGGLIDYGYYAFTDPGNADWVSQKVDEADKKTKEGKAKYRTEYVREDSPSRAGDIETGNVEYFDELSKEGVKALAKGILSRDNKQFNEDTRVDLDNLVGYTQLLKEAASSQREGYIERRNKEIKTELNNILGNVISNTPLSPEATPFILGNYNWKESEMFNGINETTKKRIDKLKVEYDLINSPRFKTAKGPSNAIGLEDSLSDVAELEARNKEREQKRQEDWDNSAAGRMTTAWGNLAYNMSNGRWGTYTETLTAGKSVDSAELKRRKQYLFKLLRNEGLSDGAIAGIIGNLENEGLSKPTAQRVSDPPGSGRYSMGIAQFNSAGELPSLIEWAKKNGLDYRTFEAQAQYIANHKVIDKIIKETQGLSPQDALRKSAIIWGHDFEIFKGHDAADNHGNLIGRGSYISVDVNKNDKHRNDGKLHGDENYTERIQKGLNTYNTYAGSDLSEITIESSNSLKQEDEEEKKVEETSFISILGKYIRDFIFNLGGILGDAKEKVDEATSPILEGTKKAVFKNGGKYSGPITNQFTDYNSYLFNQENLPEGLPAGLSYSDWKNRVYDLTGSMPNSLKISSKEDLILSKYKTTGDLNTENKAEVIKTETPKVENPEVLTEDSMLDIFDPNTYKKNGDHIKSIDDHVLLALEGINKLVGISAVTGTSTAKVVDAVNNNTMASVQSSRQAAQAVQIQTNNATRNSISLINKQNDIV